MGKQEHRTMAAFNHTEDYGNALVVATILFKIIKVVTRKEDHYCCHLPGLLNARQEAKTVRHSIIMHH